MAIAIQTGTALRTANFKLATTLALRKPSQTKKLEPRPEEQEKPAHLTT